MTSLLHYINTKLARAADRVLVHFQETEGGETILAPPTPVIIVGGAVSGGTLGPVYSNSSGQITTVEASAATISSALANVQSILDYNIGRESIATAIGPGSPALSFHRRIGRVTSTLVNGALADVALVPANAGAYYGVLKIKYVYMYVAPAGGTIQLTFQDEDNTALLGLGTNGITTITPVAATVNTQLEDVVLTQATLTDQKALEVDLDTGGGAGDNGKVVVIGYEYWYET